MHCRAAQALPPALHNAVQLTCPESLLSNEQSPLCVSVHARGRGLGATLVSLAVETAGGAVEVELVTLDGADVLDAPLAIGDVPVGQSRQVVLALRAVALFFPCSLTLSATVSTETPSGAILSETAHASLAVLPALSAAVSLLMEPGATGREVASGKLAVVAVDLQATSNASGVRIVDVECSRGMTVLHESIPKETLRAGCTYRVAALYSADDAEDDSSPCAAPPRGRIVSPQRSVRKTMQAQVMYTIGFDAKDRVAKADVDAEEAGSGTEPAPVRTSSVSEPAAADRVPPAALPKRPRHATTVRWVRERSWTHCPAESLAAFETSSEFIVPVPGISQLASVLTAKWQHPSECVVGEPFPLQLTLATDFAMALPLSIVVEKSASFVAAGPRELSTTVLPSVPFVLSLTLVPLAPGRQHLPAVRVECGQVPEASRLLGGRRSVHVRPPLTSALTVKQQSR
jgi:hypothetical protein